MPKIITDKKRIQAALRRAVDTVYPSEQFLEKELASGRQLTVYLGIDPTSTKLHIGHTLPMRKLRDFHSLGHHIILLIGDFTGRIGDPTGKDAARKQLTEEDVRANFATYRKQAAKALNFEDRDNPIEIRFNSEWLGRLSFEEVVRLSAHFTVQQMLERDMFQRRLKEEKPISLHEFLYPLMQGYDSVAMDVDIEVGGTDQTFNMLAGRTLMKQMSQKEKGVVTTPLLVDAQGKKMSKSEGNTIPLDTDAPDMYGKVMAQGDAAIIPMFVLATDVPEDQIADMEQALKKGENPRNVKARLAHTITSMYYSSAEADHAAEQFTRVFAKKQAPDEMPEAKLNKAISLVDVIVDNTLATSRSEASRLVKQGGVKLNEEKVVDPTTKIDPKQIGQGMVLQVGKRKFLRLTAGK